MASNIKARIRRLEQPRVTSYTNRVIGDFRYIGGRHGCLKVPVAQSESDWLKSCQG